MSTNPFRQINPPQNYDSSNAFAQSEAVYGGSDGGGLRSTSKELSVDTKVPPSSFDRHVSFASPPVNSTMSAVSYPSSPESARSPPIQYGQPVAPYTPDYRTAMRSDPFEDLRQESREDRTLQQALENAQTNLTSEQHASYQDQHDAVRNTLSRFASGPRVDNSKQTSDVTNPLVSSRQSMDVDAFKRLLLTGDSGQNTSLTTPLSSSHSGSKGVGDSGYGTDTASISQSSSTETSTDQTGPKSNDQDGGFASKSIPPPAPAPRRGKSVKTRTSLPADSINIDVKAQDTLEAEKPTSKPPSARKPPTPPLARRHSSKTTASRSEDALLPSPSKDLDPFATAETSQTHKAPPPPPLRRSGTATNNEQRRISHDLAPTAEESESDYEIPASTFTSSRKSSDAPPVVPRSRNSSISTSTKRNSAIGSAMTPPPVPPPRRGRGSSRSSFDSFRPTMASLMDYDGANKSVSNDQLHQHFGEESHRRISGQQQDEENMSILSPTNASNILAELADLQREVDAARRGA